MLIKAKFKKDHSFNGYEKDKEYTLSFITTIGYDFRPPLIEITPLNIGPVISCYATLLDLLDSWEVIS